MLAYDWPLNIFYFTYFSDTNKFLLAFEYYLFTSRKPIRCIGKLLKIKSKLILILFTSFVEYIYIFSFVVQNVVGKIDKETLRIGFRIAPTFLF